MELEEKVERFNEKLFAVTVVVSVVGAFLFMFAVLLYARVAPDIYPGINFWVALQLLLVVCMMMTLKDKNETGAAISICLISFFSPVTYPLLTCYLFISTLACGFAKMVRYQKERNHPFRKELKDLRRLIAALKELPSTPEVGKRISAAKKRLVQLSEYPTKSLKTSSDPLALQLEKADEAMRQVDLTYRSREEADKEVQRIGRAD